MSPELDISASDRAAALAEKAIGLLSIGDSNAAHRTLQEAVSLDADNSNVRGAFEKLQLDEAEHQLVKLCKRYIFDHQEDAGKEAIRFLTTTSEKLPEEHCRRCTEIMLTRGKTSEQELHDELFSALLRRSTAAKKYIAEQLKVKTTATFNEVHGIGDGASDALTLVVLSPDAWTDGQTRLTCEQDVFRLFMAKLLEAGNDNDSRAMRGISKLLATDAASLESLVDDETLDAMLSALDYRRPMAIKSPATLAAAKFLEAAEARGQSMLTQYVTSHFARQSTEDLVLAFSAAAALFPIATSTAATMFLTPEFLPALVPLLERKAHSKDAEMAALEMLSAACVDSACRDSIRTYCLVWVKRIATTDETGESSIAAVILSKIHQTPGNRQDKQSHGDEARHTDALVHKLTKLLFEDPQGNRNASFEGLAHQSVRPAVKQKLINDNRWLQVFLQELSQADASSPAVFGGLAILDNLTAYLPVLSEEQKKLAQLKAYANADAKSSETDPLNEEAAVSRRCKTLVEIGTVPTLVAMHKRLSTGCMAMVYKIILSLAKSPNLRGAMVQQGAVKMIASNYDKIEGTSIQATEVRRTAAQGLARLLISVDPSILFGPSGNALLHSTVNALVTLVSHDDTLALEGPRDLLPTFEALLALTNLCSVPTNGASVDVIRLARTNIEDLILGNNNKIRRAATELTNNLVQQSDGIALYANGSPEAARRLHILLALAGSEDLGTRKAAAGALATLTEFDEIIEAINRQSRGMELLLAILDDEDEDVLHRGLVSILNVLNNESKEGRTAGESMRHLDAKRKLQGSMEIIKAKDILDLAKQAMSIVSK